MKPNYKYFSCCPWRDSSTKLYINNWPALGINNAIVVTSLEHGKDVGDQ